MKYLTNYVPQEKGGMSAGYVVVEDNGVLKAQKLSFDGTTPQFDGVAEEITDVGIFETGLDEPAYNGGGGGNEPEEPKKEMPTEGLLLYEQLGSDIGSFSIRSGTPVFSKIDNIPCMLVNPDRCTLYKDSTGFPSGSSARSISTFLRLNSSNDGFGFYVVYGGNDSYVTSIGTHQNRLTAYRNGSSASSFTCEINKWYHVCVTYENGFVQMFVDGNQIYSDNYTYNTEVGANYPVGIGWLPTQNSNFNADGYISSVRIYDRALRTEEITTLANEFTPTGV